jgi:hypothetical protein
VSKIEDWAFSDCPLLKSIVIPPSVSQIGWFCFANCPNLSSVSCGREWRVLRLPGCQAGMTFPVVDRRGEFLLPADVPLSADVCGRLYLG